MSEDKRTGISDAFKALLRKQERTLNSISHAIINFKKLGQAKMHEQVANRLQFLRDQLKEAKELDSQLYIAASDELISSHDYFVDDKFNQAIEDFHEASAYMQGIAVSQSIPGLDISANTSLGAESRSESRSIARLPRVELPKFNGQIGDWEHFRDRFESLIIQDHSLTDADRMHFLNSALTDKASKAISHLKITAANFQTAWSILTDEFEDKRELTLTHLKSLISLPAINRNSPASYSELRTRIITAIQSLKNLERSPDACFDLVILLATEQFDAETKREWDFKLSEHTNFPSLEDLLKFLQIYAKVGSTNETANTKATARKQFKTVAHIGVAAKGLCPACNLDHLIFKCDTFKALSITDRFKLIKNDKRCTNCFSPQHSASNCKSKHRCHECSGTHHTLLHKPDIMPTHSKSVDSSVSVPEARESSAHLLSRVGGPDQVLLPTARIKVYSANGRAAVFRAIIDPGSQATLLTERAAQLLHLPRSPMVTHVTSVGQLHVKSTATTCIGVGVIDSSTPFVSAHTIIVSALTQYAPGQFGSRPTYPHLSHLQLADAPMSSAPFDVILGSNVCSMLIRPGIIQTGINEPAAMNTIFGWAVFGNIEPPSFSPKVSVNHMSMSSLNTDLQQFWQIEEVPERAPLTSEEKQCEQHFSDTYSRRSDGRYIVRLPFKQSPSILLGNSRHKALKCLEYLRRRLDTDPEYSKAYDRFMQEYEELGHMKRISNTANCTQPPVYIPHHGVYKRNSEESKLRVVFNASSLTTSTKSLNDCLHAGPKLQNDLPSIILRWRQFRFVLVTDITKMFRQILVDPRDVDFQRILWKSSNTSEIVEYQLHTVTYGTTCAPYLALRVINQLANDHGSEFPLALPIIQQQMYVDDFLFGGDTIDQAIACRDHLIALMTKGGFTLSKWSGNHPALLQHLNSSDRNVAFDNEPSLCQSVKVLGVVWRPVDDVFCFNVSLTSPVPATKRSVLSTVARLYDPLGWITPVSIKAKIVIQQLWRANSNWDDEIPTELYKDWSGFYQQLNRLTEIAINRWTQQNGDSTRLEIHGFADASTSAYAAVVYLKVQNDARSITHLLISKSKVAPLNTVSLPRLELCAALLLSRLVEYVRKSLNVYHVPCVCWSDSTITLAWIGQSPSKWRTFIANRVSKIQELGKDVTWRHVRSEENPADCASRGIMPSDLINHPLWWSGPSWLALSAEHWPRLTPTAPKSTDLEEKMTCQVHSIAIKPPWELQNRYSSWTRLLRVTAYIYRFIDRLKLKREKKSLPPLTFLSPEEVQRSKIFWLKQIQEQLFTEELSLLQRNQPVRKSTQLASLVPMLDSDGLIRVRGRLSNTSWSDSQKHPIILKSHPLVHLIISETHLRLLHAGPRLTLSCLRQEYWLLRARQLVRSVLHRCVICIRHSARVPEELMGELPPCRVNEGQRAFVHTGLDYAGPLPVRLATGRGYKTHKGYISVFICMATKAIHLELVTDLTTSAFLAAFTRFTSRRGSPTDMYSDNGTTFHGANNELHTIHQTVMNDPSFRNHALNTNIKWHFIPPRAPHFGGLWEAAVRSVKRHLMRCIGKQTLSLEEMTTLLCSIEACLNSRPIGPITDAIDDYNALTPAHFLIGAPLIALPQVSVLDVAENRLSRWQLIHRTTESFWKAWRNDYLHALQQRPTGRVRNALTHNGQIVLIRDSCAPPSHWLLGRIIECHPGQDGLTRVVTVRTANSEFKRAIKQLCFLPISLNQATQDVATAGGTSA